MSETREEFEKLPEISRLVICDEIEWCDVYNWYRTDNTDANSIYHVAWLNGAWYAFQERQKILDAYKLILKTQIGFDIVNSILDQSKASENQSISDDCQNGIISKGEFLISSKNSDSGQSKEVSINISKDGKITKIGD